MTFDATVFNALDTRSRKLGDMVKRYSKNPENVKFYDNADPEIHVYHVEWIYSPDIKERVMILSTNSGKFAFSPNLNQVIFWQ